MAGQPEIGGPGTARRDTLSGVTERADAGWTVVEADDPQALVAASHLFDGPVPADGAAAFLAKPGHLALLALDADGTAVGFVTGVETCHPDKGTEMFVYELGVDEAARRRGVARALLDRLAAIARERGCYALWTGTEDDNVAALATYRSWGAELDDSTVSITLPLR
jgi:ribosomal protein S18 acetylase RimI-like enzyme